MISKKRSVNFNLKEAHRIGFLIKKNKTELFVDYVYEYTNKAFLKEVRTFKIEELFLNTIKLEEFVSIFKKYFIFKNSSLKENEYFNNLFIKDRIINSEFLIQNRNDILNKIKPMIGSQIKINDSMQKIYLLKQIILNVVKYNEVTPQEQTLMLLENLSHILFLMCKKEGLFPELKKYVIFDKFALIDLNHIFSNNIANRSLDSVDLKNITNENIESVVNLIFELCLSEKNFNHSNFFIRKDKSNALISKKLLNPIYMAFKIKTKEIIGETVFNRLEDLYIDKYMLNYCEKYNIDINLSFKEKEELILNNLKNDISLIGYKSGIDNDTNFLTQEEIDALLDIVGIEED